MAKCGAKAKSTGKPCQRTGMANGRCMMHGGMTPETNQNAVKHGFYSKCYTEEEKSKLDLLKIGTLEAEIALAKTQLNRAASVPEFDEHGQPNEYYKPDFIEKWMNTIGRLEKQHFDISGDKSTDEFDWLSIARIGAALTEEVDSLKVPCRTVKTDDREKEI